MKKTVLAILLAVCMTAVCTSCSGSDQQTSSTESTVQSDSMVSVVSGGNSGDPEEKTRQANDTIKQFIESDEYVQAGKEERQKMAYQMLEELEKNGNITHLAYFEENDLFSFTYANGTLGGVTTTLFNNTIAGEPVNN